MKWRLCFIVEHYYIYVSVDGCHLNYHVLHYPILGVSTGACLSPAWAGIERKGEDYQRAEGEHRET